MFNYVSQFNDWVRDKLKSIHLYIENMILLLK